MKEYIIDQTQITEINNLLNARQNLKVKRILNDLKEAKEIETLLQN